jgi:hypothetical protein
MTTDKARKQYPPYVSYKSFKSLMKYFQQYLATRIDLSYLSDKFSVRTGSDLIVALWFLNFIDDGHRPMPVLKRLSTDTTNEYRAALLRQVADEAYAFVFNGELDIQTATYSELEAVFKKAHQLPDDICQKCIRFFINFCKDAGIPLSPEITKKQI